MGSPVLLEAATVLGFRVRISQSRWDLITNEKHPAMTGREMDVKGTLESPDEVRRSRSDDSVFLFYRLERSERWICAVAKRTNGEGFLITAYPTDAIKEGEKVWPK
jgi:hypothetical protein